MLLLQSVVNAMRAHAACCHPDEACGILLGEVGLVRTALPAANVHPAPRRHFEIDPAALIAAHRAARTGGPVVLGYYHSHPCAPPTPSAADRAGASGTGLCWIILGADGQFTCWRDTQGGLVPLPHCLIAG